MKKILLVLTVFNFSSFSPAMAKTLTGADGHKIELKQYNRIVALNATTFEIAEGLGQKNKVVGVDNGALFLDSTKDLPKVGHPYRPSVEGIISLKPDIVIATQDSLPETSAQQLRAAKVPVLVLSTSYKDGYNGLYERIKIMGKVLDSENQARKLIKKIKKDVADLEKSVREIKQKKKVFFLYAHSTSDARIYGKDTGSHFLIELIGARNAADFATGVKPLTAEAMVQASPDSIIMMQRGLDAVGGLSGAAKMPGVSLTPAGKEKKIFVVDNTVRWIGPRFPAFAKKLFNEVYGSKTQN